jgi:hypothetical protein
LFGTPPLVSPLRKHHRFTATTPRRPIMANSAAEFLWQIGHH